MGLIRLRLTFFSFLDFWNYCCKFCCLIRDVRIGVLVFPMFLDIWVGSLLLIGKMAGNAAAKRAVPQFEFELVEGDFDQQTTVVASTDRITPWIDPAKIKLRHRIGRGIFGDVWLATHNESTDKDYAVFREVAVKMLHPIKEDSIGTVLNMLTDLFSKCEGLETVCNLQGVSIIGGKVREFLLSV